MPWAFRMASVSGVAIASPALGAPSEKASLMFAAAPFTPS